jgi:hypothetical protein
MNGTVLIRQGVHVGILLYHVFFVGVDLIILLPSATERLRDEGIFSLTARAF